MARSILVIHQGAVGDFILSLPALQTIRAAFPGRGFELLGYPATLRLGASPADRITSIDCGGLSGLYGDGDALPDGARLYLAAFERIFVFSAKAGSVFTANIRRCNRACSHIMTFPHDCTHVIDWQLAQLRSLGLEPAAACPHLAIGPADAAAAADFLQQQERSAGPLVAVHPGSGSPAKTWPREHLIEALETLRDEVRPFFLHIAGPAEEAVPDGLSPLPHAVIRNTPLPFVAAVLARCDLFIGNDSGISHLAAAAGAPTAAVFGPTDPAVWGPRGAAVRIVRSADGEQLRWPAPQAVLDSCRSLLAVDKT
jgi:ADP-heptose:LPS heptosyltransferase